MILPSGENGRWFGISLDMYRYGFDTDRAGKVKGDDTRVMIVVLSFSGITIHLCSAVPFSDYGLSRPVFLFIFYSPAPSNIAPSDFHRHPRPLTHTPCALLYSPLLRYRWFPCILRPSPVAFRFPDYCNLRTERDTNIVCRWSGRWKNGSQYDERRPSPNVPLARQNRKQFEVGHLEMH